MNACHMGERAVSQLLSHRYRIWLRSTLLPPPRVPNKLQRVEYEKPMTLVLPIRTYSMGGCHWQINAVGKNSSVLQGCCVAHWNSSRTRWARIPSHVYDSLTGDPLARNRGKMGFDEWVMGVGKNILLGICRDMGLLHANSRSYEQVCNCLTITKIF